MFLSISIFININSRIYRLKENSMINEHKSSLESMLGVLKIKNYHYYH